MFFKTQLAYFFGLIFILTQNFMLSNHSNFIEKT